MPLIKATTGWENVARASAEVYLWHTPNGTQRDRKEVVLSASCNDQSGLVSKIGSPQYVGAVIGVDPKIGGQWVTQSYEVANGQILKIYATKRSSWRSLKDIGNQFLLTRDEAPFHRVKVRLLGLQDTKYQFAEVTGRFDILTLEDARAHGVQVNPAYVHLFDPKIAKDLFIVETLEKGISAGDRVQNQTIATPDGDTSIPRRRPLREMEF